MTIFLRICCVVFAAAVLSSGASAQHHFTTVVVRPLNLEPPSRAQVGAVLASLPPDERAAIAQAASEVFPVFIFLPGIMGSKLTKTKADGSQKLIWGELNGIFSKPDKDFAYAETDNVSATVLDEYYALGRAVDIYGSAINTIRNMDLSVGKIFYPFAYDWRQSNVRSASDFSKWMCSLKPEVAGRPVVFLAHSMGGLVLKYWLKHEFENTRCAPGGQKFSDWIKVKKVIFLGTPHFGAPKAIAAFADRYYLLVDPDSLSGRVFGGIDANVLSGSVNNFGATFPSAYELLPIVNTTGCFKRPDWPYPVELRQPDGAVHTHIDLFNAYTWQVWKWPRQLSPTIEREEFVKNRLPELLKSARAFLCDIAEYEPQKKFDVVRFFGHNNKTVCRVTVVQAAKEADPATIEPRYCDEDAGDGTVPTWVAAEAERSNVDSSRPAAKAHANLLSSREFINYLRFYRDELHRTLHATYEKKHGNVTGLVKLYAGLRYVVPAAADADDNDTSARIARTVLATLDVAPATVYAFAKKTADPLARANAFRVAADTLAADDTKKSWALTNAAHILLSQGNFATAFRVGKNAVAVAEESAAGDKVKGNAALITAVAAERLKYEDFAKTYGTIAASFGNPLANRFRNDP